jgi:hypothetical protein
MKRGSSLWIKTKSATLQDFNWQNGNGMFSIGFSQIPMVKQYILNQEQHHRTISFQDEFREFVRRFSQGRQLRGQPWAERFNPLGD